MADNILSVSQLNTYLKSVVDGLAPLRRVLIRGEVSNFVRYYKTGHVYLTLKDDKSAIKVVIFKRYADALRFPIENGMGLIVAGQATVYEKDGNCQIIGYDAMPDGAGAAHIRLKQLVDRLRAEGLFDEDRKKPLPRFPSVIGVITSRSGAALSDIRNTARTRWPLAKLLLLPVMVQGERAPGEIRRAIRYFSGRQDVDVLLISRGGGASEDLSAFNDEGVARAAAACPHPVISAVGHEIDVTVLDMVADARASTPTFGAMVATPDRAELAEQLQGYRTRLLNAQVALLQRCTVRLKMLKQRPALASADYTVKESTHRLDGLRRAMLTGMGERLAKEQKRLGTAAGKLDAMSPLKVLERGYTLVFDEKDALVPLSRDLTQGQTVTIRFADGSADGTITKVMTETEAT